MSLDACSYFIWFGCYFGLALAYVQIAKKYQIVDLPNQRSSHDRVTIRGGGVVIPISIVVASFFYDYFSVYFGLAILLLASVSFFDDLGHISVQFRMPFQLFLVFTLLILDPQLQAAHSWHWTLLVFGAIAFAGAVNMYNFMDGINGLNGCYTLLAVLTIAILDPLNTQAYYYVSLAVIVLCFFNARPKGRAIFFSGDIGSITSGFLVVYTIAHLVANQGTIIYSCLIMVYIVDAGWTIVLRILRKENIFEAHRSHFYQLLANENGKGHLTVTLYYVLLQLLINLSVYWVISHKQINPNLWTLGVFFSLTLAYFGFRPFLVSVKTESAN